jgi:DNA polymerase III subunit delta'
MNQKELPWHSVLLAEILAARDRMPHAWLLTGLHGIGKSRFALALANALLCESPAPNGLACGRCDACGWFGAGNHPDFRLLEPLTDEQGKTSKDIRIDQVRALAEFVNVSGHRGRSRPVIIDPADALNVPAANALLKTLEEPADGVVFLLVSSRSDALPATIRSRCRVMHLDTPPLQQALAWLQGETGSSSGEGADWLAMAGGSPLRAAGFAEPAQATAYRSMLEAIVRLPDTPSVAVADALQRWEARQWLPVLQRWVMDLMRTAAGAEPRYFPAQAPRLSELARRTTVDALARSGRHLAVQFRQVEHPLNPRLFCEESLEAYLDAYGTGPRGVER